MPIAVDAPVGPPPAIQQPQPNRGPGRTAPPPVFAIDYVQRPTPAPAVRPTPLVPERAPTSALPPISAARATLFAALGVASIAAYLQYSRLAALSGALAAVTALADGAMTLPAAAQLGAFVALGSMLARAPEDDALRPYALWALFAGGYALSRGYVSGFERHLTAAPMRLRADGTLFWPSLNLDKTLACATMLLCAGVPRHNAPSAGSIALMRNVAAPSAAVVGAMLLPALLSGYVRLDPMLHPSLMPWLVHNLALVAIPEETLYRGVLPLALMRSLPERLATPYVVVPVSAALFGFTHHQGGMTYVALSTLAGVGYSLAALRAGGIAGSVAAHVLLNTVHFALFTYPALQR